MLINCNDPLAQGFFLLEKLNFDTQMQAYADIIIRCKKRDLIEFHLPNNDHDQAFRVAPWCFVAGSQIYHDFKGAFEDASGLEKMASLQGYFTKGEAVQAGISDKHWETWVDRMYVVPVSPN